MPSVDEDIAQSLIQVGWDAYARGWVPATSGNFSCRAGMDRIAITVSGRHKGHLTRDDIMLVDGRGVPVMDKRPSAETLLHVQLYDRYPDVHAVLHTHSVRATALSRLVTGSLHMDGYEVFKAFTDIETHETDVDLPVFPNDQDMTRLAGKVATWLEQEPRVPGYLIQSHGLYTWGHSVADAMRHLEAFEFLFECELEIRKARP